MVSLACNLFRGLWSHFAHEEKEHFLHCSSRAISSITLSARLYLSPTIKAALFWMTFLQFRSGFHLQEHVSHLHLYFSWTSALHKHTNPILKLRNRILPFRALQKRKQRHTSTKVTVIERQKNSNHCLLGRDNTFIHSHSHAGGYFMGQNSTIQVSEIV